MRQRLLGEGELLDEHGALCESGYAFSQVKHYERSAIRAGKLRIKEWDYYCLCDENFAVALTVADNSYMSLASVSVMDFTHLKYTTKSKIGLMSMGKLQLPNSCERGNSAFEKGGVKLLFSVGDDGARKLSGRYKKFDGKKDFECEFVLVPTCADNITVAVPFDKPKQFYYNTKVNCFKVNGWFTVGDERYEFTDACGGLDWGRGVWPFKSNWYWSSMSCVENGVPFGLNLGYGFGKPSATENTVFYGGKANKLGEVKFEIPYNNGLIDYLKPWKITDDAGRLSFMFYPMINRNDHMRVFGLMTDQNQVFGKFYGKAVTDDGTIVSIVDKTGFAEHVTNQW